MGTIAEKLTYLNSTKSAIKTAIEAKGVTVGDATFREYATKIGEITTGGGSGYQRVSGVPNLLALYDAGTFPEMEVEGITYMPIWGGVANANWENDVTLEKTQTGADAYLYSDDLTTLVVGTSDTHSWDCSKDFETEEGWYCRYYVAYVVKSGYTYSAINVSSFYRTFEFIGFSNFVINYNLLWSGSTTNNASFVLIDLSRSSVRENRIGTHYTCSYGYKLKEVRLPDSLTLISAHDAFAGSALEKIVADGLTTVNNYNNFQSIVAAKVSFPALTSFGASASNFCFSDSVREVYAPNITTMLGNTKFQSRNLTKIDYSNVTSLDGTVRVTAYGLTWTVIADNFNIAVVNFATSGARDWHWWNEYLPIQLADRSATTAGVIYANTANIALITAETQTAIAEKNWTIVEGG